MIIVRLIGGLGNQMFQYAAGRRLAHTLKTDLKLDLSGYQTQNRLTPRRYNLHVFNIMEKIAAQEEIAALIGSRFTSVILFTIEKFIKLKLAPRTYINRISETSFDPTILTLPDGVYWEGHWQSEKYFIDIVEIIREEFTFKNPPVDKNKELSKLISSLESVSLHVRRTDYVTNPKAHEMHGSCNIDYYRGCVNELIEKVKNPHFFIFSDDPGWASENLKLQYPMTIVNHNQEDQCHEDLRLMSQCKHHIIANSSFSWWAAWLNPRADKIVFAPGRWYIKPVYNNIEDILPATWLKR